ncbi:MAG: hypothetical protein AB1705_04350 [Verrucomicrobiota bacterium]
MNNDTAEFLAKVRVASPCPARWEDMQGDERARFCAHCQKHVYNFSAMNGEEVVALIRAKEGSLCGRFYQRSDGTMLTADCPVGQNLLWGRVKRMLAGGAAMLLFVNLSIAAAFHEKPANPRRLAELRAQAIQRAQKWMGVTPPVRPMPPGGIGLPVAGGICAPPSPPAPPQLAK